MFTTKWDKDRHAELHDVAATLFKIIFSCLDRANVEGNMANKSTRQLAALGASFIVGLAELNSSGHIETERVLLTLMNP